MSPVERRPLPALLAGLALLLSAAVDGSAQPIEGAQAWQAAAAAKIRPRLSRSIVGARSTAAVTVVVRFAVDRAGRASRVTIARSSGSRRLDRAALKAVRRASPLPPLDWTGRNTAIFALPIRFNPGVQSPEPRAPMVEPRP